MTGLDPNPVERVMSDSEVGTTGKIVWFEIPAAETSRAKEFYGSLFGWQFQASEDMDYHMTFEGGGGIYGGSEDKGVKVYFGVEDMQAALDRVRELGGEPGEPQEIPGFGVYALCTDTEGNSFGLLRQEG